MALSVERDPSLRAKAAEEAAEEEDDDDDELDDDDDDDDDDNDALSESLSKSEPLVCGSVWWCRG